MYNIFHQRILFAILVIVYRVSCTAVSAIQCTVHRRLMWSDDADLSGNLAHSAYGPIYYGSSSGSRRSHTFSVVVVETSTVCDKRIIILHAFVR